MSVYNIYTFNMNAVQEYGHVIINKYISSGTVYKSGVLYIYIYLFILIQPNTLVQKNNNIIIT